MSSREVKRPSVPQYEVREIMDIPVESEQDRAFRAAVACSMAIRAETKRSLMMALPTMTPEKRRTVLDILTAGDTNLAEIASRSLAPDEIM